MAAPCCAGSNAVPALITGDEAQNLSLGVSYGETIGNAPGAGEGLPVFRDNLSNQETKKTLTFNYARLLDGDRLQAGASVPLVMNSLRTGGQSASSTELGDISLTAGYETLPEWEYSEWKPRVFSFFQTTLPTAKSTYESLEPLSTNVGGMGQFQMAIGSLAIKRWSNWDSNLVFKASRIFGRSFSGGLAGPVTLGSSWGLAASVGVGYSFFERFRAGLSLAPDYQSPVAVVTDSTSGLTSQRLVWNSGISLTYLIGSDDSLILNYNDQTRIGPAINTALLRTASLSFTRRIER